MIKVAFQGERGAYSETATFEFFGEEIDFLPCSSFDLVFQSVEAGSCKYGIVPIETSLTGSIHHNYDLLLRHDLSIVGEVDLRLAHCLIGQHGVKLEHIKRVYSHPEALAECKTFLGNLGVELVPKYDGAGSVKLIREQGLRDGGAIASERAAQMYNMAILAEGIEDNPHNYTRFLILATEDIAPRGESKTSIVFSLENVAGALFKALSVFALRDIDLTKIESRPLKRRPWEYFFYLDFSGSMADDRCKNAIKHLQEITPFLRILGSYPRWPASDSLA